MKLRDGSSSSGPILITSLPHYCKSLAPILPVASYATVSCLCLHCWPPSHCRAQRHHSSFLVPTEGCCKLSVFPNGLVRHGQTSSWSQPKLYIRRQHGHLFLKWSPVN
ncbi:expressed unknown protein [Seminavis robusta]|uniref:Uncharacterized protein n=1 Tax=Seminavis robusta TaxID=568900 RepID=A0A9N8HEX4_9STRA|nr:expressed unknown protein [Seminavis robusta]|eukprot:Sro405_g136281.1  (108) ;mRNA; f:62960-63283